MGEKNKITEAESKILNVIWNAPEPIRIRDMMEELEKQDIHWANRTMLSFLRSMEQKEAVGKIRRGVTNYYYPLIEKENFVGEKVSAFLNRYFAGSLTSMVSMFVKNKGIKQEDIDGLREWMKTLD